MYLKQTSEYNLIFVLQYFIAIRTKKKPTCISTNNLEKKYGWYNSCKLANFFFLILQMYLGSFKGQGIDFSIARP